MNIQTRKGFIFILLIIAFFSCTHRSNETYETNWLGNNRKEVLHNIEEQFQGFSRTMWEMSYSYQEPYWAGIDQNWKFAEYQREHMDEALVQGLVRRPDRTLSSQSFINSTLPNMKATIGQSNPDLFSQSFDIMTVACNNCHKMENVAFITIKTPENRHTIVHFK